MNRPGEDANASEIARWMEEDFDEAIAEAAKESLAEADDDDSTEE